MRKATKEKTKKTETVKKKTSRPKLSRTSAKEEVKKKPEKKLKYFEAVGHRKTSQAQVRLFSQGEKEIFVNKKPYKEYFPVYSLQKKVEAPLEILNCLGKFGVSIKVKGGGISAQAEACRHGISKTLILLNPLFRKRLKKAGFLTRDSRMRERKKFGLKRARKAPQWSKR